MKTLNIGFLGAGTVGGGAIQIIVEKATDFAALGINLKLHKICVRELSRKSQLPNLGECEFTTDWQEVVNDPEIDVVVEVMGGTGVATEAVIQALDNGKHVVTANKALIADNFVELVERAAQSGAPMFGFEAAVGGGIPIISTLQHHARADKVTEVAGILNGTTNYMLSKMSQEGMSYESVLKEAQDLGFAEADPTADVGGYDARSKTVILAQLAYGILINEAAVHRMGIDRVQTIDFEYAAMMGKTIKLLGVSRAVDENSVTAYVSPVVLPDSIGAGQIHGATNIVTIKSSYQAETALVGQGVGSLPTGTSIVADLIRIAQADVSPSFHPPKTLTFEPDFESCFYIRFNIQDGVGIIKTMAAICEKHQISIDSIWQLPLEDKSNLPFVLVTETCKLSQIEALCAEIEPMEFVRDIPLFLPIQ